MSDASAKLTFLFWAVGFMVVVFGAIWLFFDRVVRRKLAEETQQRYQFATGESATTAIAVSSLEQAAPAAERIPCTCGGRLVKGAAAFEASRLGDDEVHSARFACDQCGRARPLYFRVGTVA